jgi:hypothetical protein
MITIFLYRIGNYIDLGLGLHVLKTFLKHVFKP